MLRTLPFATAVLALAGVGVIAQNPGSARSASLRAANRYIVVLGEADDPAAVGSETAGRFGGRLNHVYTAAVRGFAIQLPEAAARALEADPRVRYVAADGVVTATDVQSAAPWGLDRIDQRALPLDGTYTHSASTTAIHAYVIDTGIRITHVEFGGRAFIGGDYIDDDGDGDPNDIANDDADPAPDGADCNGHGTHVAGTIGGETYGVAKSATLWAHRALDCTGNGLVSDVIAAVDAITARHQSPAVVNMSLSGDANLALDDAIRGSIAAGVTYVVAAGNDNIDAIWKSPARVAEAITVGASSSLDARASFSNYGPLLDIFAPGVSIRSAFYTDDTAIAVLSGTSMATPHVAGAAAVYLQGSPAAAPSVVRDALIAAATPGVVSNAGTDSPNLLLYTTYSPPSGVPSVAVRSPNGGEKLFTGTPYAIEWDATSASDVQSFDVYSSLDGVAFSPVAGCTSLAPSARQCTWAAPGPAAAKTYVQVKATTSSTAVFDVSDAPFAVVSGIASVVVQAPNKAVNWGRGSTQQIKWTHNLGAASYVRLELSRDSGATYSEVIASKVQNTSASSGTFNWQVTGPTTSSARIRVSWASGPTTTDMSDAPFTIAEPYITVSAPTSSTSWGYGTVQQQRWVTNLGPLDTVSLQLSTDGGVSYSRTLAANVAAASATANVTIPTLPAPTASARVRVVWDNPPAGFAGAGVNPAAFRIEPPYVTLISPNGGETWTAGTAATVSWRSNLGRMESVTLMLSRDGGTTMSTTVLAATPSDGAQSVVVSAAWATTQGVLQVAWVKNTTVADRSDAAFRVQ